MRHGDLAVLVATLLFVGDLVFDLQRAGAGFDHLLGQQIGRLGIAETGVDIGDDRHDMGFVIIDRLFEALCFQRVALCPGGIEFAEQPAQLARIGLLEEGVEFADQRRDAGFFVHRLIGQRAEFAAQRGHHPARQIEVAALGGAEMLLDADQLLLRDEAVPAAKRLRVMGRVRIIGSHVLAHDVRGVAGNVEPGGKAVLDLHPRRRFCVDGSPGGPVTGNGAVELIDGGLVGHDRLLRGSPLGMAIICAAQHKKLH